MCADPSDQNACPFQQNGPAQKNIPEVVQIVEKLHVQSVSYIVSKFDKNIKTCVVKALYWRECHYHRIDSSVMIIGHVL